ncbi:MAG: FAD-binding domain-containing protein [Chromatiales bacterium]|jgi:deoxyribodipyrimidine photo-lyase
MAGSASAGWAPTRSAALDRLEAFVGRAGRSYAAERNYDDGPEQRSNVSGLSPWIRHRLVLEEEVLTRVLQEHSAQAAEKFIQELCWRTYWKGWLEMRPQVWRDYRAAVTGLHAQLDEDVDLRARWQQATAGETGLECFDEWARELIETGYLHNHTRMWFASIWVFTLRLPWELGADFFLRYLLDGDAASNTLSWRWVAGLQTPGKTYLARADNIARYTRGRFRPRGGLAEQAELQSGAPVPTPRPLETPVSPVAGRRTGLLLTDDDLRGDVPPVPRDALVGIAGFSGAAERSPWPVSRYVLDFSSRALDDGLDRAAGRLGLEATRLDSRSLTDRVIAWCERHELEQIVMPCVPVGVARDALAPVEIALEERGIRVAQFRRSWDDQLWPHATHGYFRFRKAIGSVVNRYHCRKGSGLQ